MEAAQHFSALPFGVRWKVAFRYESTIRWWVRSVYLGSNRTKTRKLPRQAHKLSDSRALRIARCTEVMVRFRMLADDQIGPATTSEESALKSAQLGAGVCCVGAFSIRASERLQLGSKSRFPHNSAVSNRGTK